MTGRGTPGCSRMILGDYGPLNVGLLVPDYYPYQKLVIIC